MTRECLSIPVDLVTDVSAQLAELAALYHDTDAPTGLRARDLLQRLCAAIDAQP